MKKQVMLKMWQLLNDGLATDKATALKAAWLLIKIKNQESTSFQYVKADGTLRLATATTLIPCNKMPKGEGRQMPKHICTYFDITANDWRSFDIQRLAI